MSDPGTAWAWVEALRAGSTTPWAQWRLGGTTASAAGRDLPGVQQLELLRRVNLVRADGAPGAPGAAPSGAAALADRILMASATGRGAPDHDLVGAAQRRPWGLAPIDPAELSDGDLLRVAVTLLAEDLVTSAGASGAPVGSAPRRLARRLRRRLRGRRDGHRVVGDPWLALSVRDELLRTGRPLGGPASTVVIVGQDVASMLVGAYTARAFDGGAPSWERWLGSVVVDRVPDHLPPRADLAAVAREWSDSVGRERVVVVPAPRGLAPVLGLPASARPRLTPPTPSADAVDLARRVGTPLGLLVPADVRRRLLRRTLLPALLADDAARQAAPLGVPATHLPWVVRRAEQMRDDLRAAGYAVSGDLQDLVPAAVAGLDRGAARRDASQGSADTGVLALAVRLLVAAPAPTAPQHRQSRRESR